MLLASYTQSGSFAFSLSLFSILKEKAHEEALLGRQDYYTLEKGKKKNMQNSKKGEML